MSRRSERAARALARAYPWPVAPGEELAHALGFLPTDLSPATVVRAGYGAALVALPLVGLVGTLAGLPAPAVVAGTLGTALGAAHAVHRLPVVLAHLRRTAALGAAPNLLGRAVLRMRTTPAPERAAAFAAAAGEGPLADALDEHVRRARGTSGTGLRSFAREWGERFPALRRGVLLVEAAATAPAGDRSRTLDRAMRAVLDGTRDRMATFVADVRGPATALYAFGVLLPLALVSVLPAARVAGLPVSVAAVVAVYDVALPVGVAGAGVWLLARRPVAFRPAPVPPDHPDLPARRWPRLLAAAGVAAVAWALAGRLLGWAGPVGAAGVGAGAALRWWYRPERAVRGRARAVESGLADALALVGQEVTAGTAAPSALPAVADHLDGELGAVLAEADRRSRQLRVGVGEALVGEYGPLAHLPSPRARSAAALLDRAAVEGRPAGDAAVALADHVEELASVEREARAALSRVTDTLASTGALFAPLVGGTTVGLAGAMAGVGGTRPLPAGPLGLAVGGYVLALAVLLTALSVALERGLDRALVGHRVGGALLVATPAYLLSVAAAGALA
jgi:hypothetical protein